MLVTVQRPAAPPAFFVGGGDWL